MQVVGEGWVQSLPIRVVSPAVWAKRGHRRPSGYIQRGQDKASGKLFLPPSKHVLISLKVVSSGKIFLMLKTGTRSEVLFRGATFSLFS